MLWLEANTDHSPGKMDVECLILEYAYLTKYTTASAKDISLNRA